MCGLAGVIAGGGLKCDGDAVVGMLRRIVHRGPDDQGVWNEGPAWLGFRRLSIIDLSEAGHQPMISRDGRFVITFNGEIYNHHAIRRELEAIGVAEWRGHSDTETLLEAFSHFGVEQTLKRANGMFGIALWDRREQELTLARDRFGEKPLYYAPRGEGVAFASEMTSLEALPGLDLEIDREALAAFFSRAYFGSPLSVYRGVRQVAPGGVVTFKAGQPIKEARYWCIAEAARKGHARPVEDNEETIDELESVIRDAVGLRMEADVPLGAFLSGGVDSSLVVALMQQLSSRPVRTFTLGFEIPRFNEADFARAVANHLGVEHTEHIVTVADAMNLVPKMGGLYDQPFADSSQIPTYMVSALARRHVTVALTGDGADELFAGYRRYYATPAMWDRLRRLPARGLAGAALAHIPPKALKAMFFFLQPLARKYGRADDLGLTLRRIAPWLGATSGADLHDRSIAAWSNPLGLVQGARRIGRTDPGPEPEFRDLLEALCWRDQVNYLSGDILTKVDRASMAVSLETRVPLLDPAVAEFAWRLPTSMKMENGKGKLALRRVLYRHVPRELIERTKMGFGVPLGEWLRGDLRPWAEDLLSDERLRRQGLLDPALVARKWRSYVNGDSIHDTEMWSVLMLQSWLDHRGK